jgi:hypothetical protein
MLLLFTSLIDVSAQEHPVLFGRDIISTGDFDFKVAFTPNQKRVYFSRSYNSWSTIIILYSDKNKDVWSEPELVSFSSGTYRDADPCVSQDGSKLYFISDRPAPGEAYKDFAYSIYSVDLDKKGNTISDPKKVAIPVPGNINPLYPSIAGNGNIYFSAAKDRDQGIYVSEWKDGAYQMARLLDFNSDANVDLDPVVSYNESFIIFTSNRKGVGKMDLWVSFNQNGKWGEPVNLGQTINSVENEGQAGLSYDQSKLYFTGSREPKTEKQLTRKITYAQLKSELQSANSGMGNIYEVDISELLKSLSSLANKP